jgi:hypothetical protein
MKGLENSMYAVLLLVSNLAAVLLLVASVKLPRAGRALFGLLFTASALINWYTVQNNPEVYLDYRNFSIIQYFHSFVEGWFTKNELLVIASLSVMQFLIAVGLQMKGLVFKIACVFAIILLMSSLALGVGLAFPASVIMAFGVYFLMRPVPGAAIHFHPKKPVLQ